MDVRARANLLTMVSRREAYLVSPRMYPMTVYFVVFFCLCLFLSVFMSCLQEAHTLAESALSVLDMGGGVHDTEGATDVWEWVESQLRKVIK